VASPTRRLPAVAVIGSALVLLVAVAGYLAIHAVQPRPVAAPPPPPGCQAGTGGSAIPLGTEQAGIAATIAGVAARHQLGRQALTIAYAAALQESQLQDLDYGDRDSVGVFQQRPSQGWGTTAEIENPVYATTKFFAALVQVSGYTTMPIDQAAQDVQHSADGDAYQQWAGVAALLAGYFTGAPAAGVSCWYSAAGQADLAGAEEALTATFGPAGRGGVLAAITTDRSVKKKKEGSDAVVRVRRDAGWAVASWLVAYAQQYGISEVRYAGYVWHAADGSMGWQRDSPARGQARGDIVAS
jgi:hypothetical protein